MDAAGGCAERQVAALSLGTRGLVATVINLKTGTLAGQVRFRPKADVFGCARLCIATHDV
jgi:hypothetical protein